MLEEKSERTNDPKCVMNKYFTVNSVWIIGFLCVIASLLIILYVSSLHSSYAANEQSVVNIQFKNQAVPYISIVMDYADSSDERSEKNQLDGKLQSTGGPMETTEQIETTERMETTTKFNPKDLILQTFRNDENETKRLTLKYYGNMDGSEDFRPLSAAAERCNAKVAKMLIENGANVNIKGGGGWSPIHVAIFNNCKNIVQVLIGAGANLNARINLGYSALELATNYGRQEIVGLLSKALKQDQPATTENYTEGDEHNYSDLH